MLSLMTKLIQILMLTLLDSQSRQQLMALLPTSQLNSSMVNHYPIWKTYFYEVTGKILPLDDLRTNYANNYATDWIYYSISKYFVGIVQWIFK